jgi:hypothetical protein
MKQGSWRQKKFLMRWLNGTGNMNGLIPSTFSNAFTCCDFQAMKIRSFPLDRQVIDAFSKRAEGAYKNASDPVEKMKVCAMAKSFLESLADVAGWEQKIQALSQSSAYLAALRGQQNNESLDDESAREFCKTALQIPTNGGRNKFPG